MNNLINQMTCEISRQIYWDGFFNGTGLITFIWLAYEIYKYFMKNKYDVKIEITERKEPKL